MQKISYVYQDPERVFKPGDIIYYKKTVQDRVYRFRVDLLVVELNIVINLNLFSVKTKEEWTPAVVVRAVNELDYQRINIQDAKEPATGAIGIASFNARHEFSWEVTEDEEEHKEHYDEGEYLDDDDYARYGSLEDDRDYD